jgi:hypothetical protein
VDFCSEQTRDNVVGGVVLGGTAVTGIIDIQHKVTAPETDLRMRVLRIYAFHQIRTMKVS